MFPINFFLEELAWADKGLKPADVPDAQFKFIKLGHVPGNFFNFGVIDLPVSGVKRTKNARKMHMMFVVISGAVMVRVHENEFTIHKGGIWQVPRGES